jgi:hypothetical protein
MNDANTDWAAVTELAAGRVQDERFAVMLQVRFRQPTLPGTPLAPEQKTLPLYMTERQAKDLLLLLAHALGLPGTGMPQPPTKPTH